MISFAGNVTYPKMQPLRDVARELPLDRILTETDSPFLSPQSRRGKRNEPAYVVEVAQALATVRNLAPDEVAAQTAANFREFFALNPARGVPDSGQEIEGNGWRSLSKSRRVFSTWFATILALVERELAAQSDAAIEPVAEISSYLREGGGKRLRPALLLLLPERRAIAARARSTWARSSR